MNTIYDGTFVIGQTSATNFEAGPGISITQPSEGTVRIANDETVLWSGSATITATTGINTNEPYTNFERLQFYGKTYHDQFERMYGEVISTDTTGYIPFMLSFPNGNNDTLRFASFQIQTTATDYTKFLISKGKIWNLSNNAVSTGTFMGTLTKVVGINRKEV